MAPSKHHDPNLLYPAPAGNSGLGPEALAGFEAGGGPVEADVPQQPLVELGELASRTGKLSSTRAGLACVACSSATARLNENEGASAWANSRTLDRVDMT